LEIQAEKVGNISLEKESVGGLEVQPPALGDFCNFF